MDRKAHRLSVLSTGCAGLFAAVGALALATSATAGHPITIWVVGSPYTDHVPKVPAAVHLRDEARRSGYDVSVESFRARGFADVFADAVVRDTVPDVLVFDNFGVMNGITTNLGRFEGVGRDPTVRAQFVKVTGAFDELLGPARGWTYLFTSSANHTAARDLALRAPACTGGSGTQNADKPLASIVTDVAIAYLKGDIIGVQAYSDSERIAQFRLGLGATAVGDARICGVWANDTLAFAAVTVAYEAEGALGEARVLLVLRKSASRWRLLVATRDPIATGEFVNTVPWVIASLTRDRGPRALPIPATLTAPATGQFPPRRPGERFGSFTWESSPSSEVVAEIAEFVYADDTRLFLVVPSQAAVHSGVSAGQLWSTERQWLWRIWSIARTGELGFSEFRTFVH
jgi:hypothetical protein